MDIPGKRNVLIVDDEPSVRMTLEKLLKSSHYETTVAADGQEALDRAAEQEFEVVLLDIRMPGLSGLDVLDRLHGQHPDTGVIMATAVDDVTTAVGAMKRGAYDYVVKPFSLDDVLMRVEKARERRYLALLARDYETNLEERVKEQARDMRELTAQTIQALVREETLAGELEAEGERKRSPGVDVRGFAAKILERLRND